MDSALMKEHFEALHNKLKRFSALYLTNFLEAKLKPHSSHIIYYYPMDSMNVCSVQ